MAAKRKVQQPAAQLPACYQELMDEKSSQVLTIEEWSAYLKIQKTTLYKLVQKAKAPCQKIARHWHFRKVAIARWREATQAVRDMKEGGNEQ